MTGSTRTPSGSSTGSVTPRVFNIPPHRPFADSLAAGLLSRFAAGDQGLASGTLLVPSNRAARALQDAFVRRARGGLLLPRIIPVGDVELGERVGGALDPIGDDPIPPAVQPLARLMLLARLVQRHRGGEAPEALRLAEELARTLDQLLIQEVAPRRLKDFAADLPELSQHWQTSLEQLKLITQEWPELLRARGEIDLAERRNRLLSALAGRWAAAPPRGFVCAAGITTAAPAVARLLRTVARLPQGLVVLPGLDCDLSHEEWEALGPHAPDAATGIRRPSAETHPQYQLKLLLDQMGVGRAEVEPWRAAGVRSTGAARTRAVGHALAPAAFTGRWQELQPAERRLTGVRALELADPAEEAQAIAVALREALETPGRTAALVTPDRALARRVSAHLRRWGVVADDSAGRPLSETPPGTLLLGLASAAAERFAPVALLSVLKHPLVKAGEERLDWLDGARRLDRALRGPRPPAGLQGISDYLSEQSGRGGSLRAAALPWWRTARGLLEPLEAAFARAGDFGATLAVLREAASALSGEGVWAGPAGRAAAELFADLEAAASEAPATTPDAVPPMLEQVMRSHAVRPPYGQHPRIFIWGLLEARLQQADLMVLGGLNEGVWPAASAPDPWLAPKLRAELDLPSADRRIGLAAHDFASFLGSPQVLVTRARREARGPAVASRFWLRLEAMTGGITRSPQHRRWASAIDRPLEHRPAARPAPAPDPAKRPRQISVTEVDRLKADPYAFYARKMLGLVALDDLDADPTPAWRGNAVHKVLEEWMKNDDCDPERLPARAEALLRAQDAHPLMRALWQPRLMEAIGWIAEQVAQNQAAGRVPVAAEARGVLRIAGVELSGVADRIDRLPDGRLAIIDYKTGNPPSARAVADGYALQLGLLGLIAGSGGFRELEGEAACFEYWSLARKNGQLGYVASPVGGRNGIPAEHFTALAAKNFSDAAAMWLTGDAPFTAKLHPDYAPYVEYDQLMRRDEWYGREDDAA